MDENETYTRRQLAGTDSQAPSRDGPDVSYVELNVTALSASRVRRDEDGLTSTYAELNFPKDEPLINEGDSPPIASGPRKLPNNGQTGPYKRESKENIGNRPYRKICLFCLVASALIAIVAGLSIYVLQIRQSQITSNRNQQILCQFLTTNREQACSQDWIKNEDRCYFISTLETSYDAAKKNCSNVDARLLEINSKEEENVVSNALVHQDRTYWIGKCAHGEAVSSLMYKHYSGTSACGNCDTVEWRDLCNRQHHFICEKSEHLFKDIPEKIQDLCQQSLRPT
ncbi:killer cell lectin-like receptor subfamily B member 1B allele B [Hemitrygon akajei]|uniref:killer cell lectin-like receptor subfamily B member 1B allele B n=1 Tax=Hemitrygon akajei TaxID=2704970 RepID=UPI003BF96121